MPIYTRTGDKGNTSLFGGKRVLKCNDLVDVYGSIDELNSHIGIIRSLGKIKKIDNFMQLIQEDLFTIGSSMAGAKTDLSILDDRILEMEINIDVTDKKLPELRNFILPGGSETASYVHLARSVARRVERQTVALSKKQKVNPAIIRYLNRLSDLLFVMARYINKKQNIKEQVWKSGKED